MGNKQEGKHKSVSEIFGLKDYNHKDQKKDEVYGDMLLLQDEEGQSALKQKVVNDENSLQRISPWLDLMQNAPCSQLVKLQKYYTNPDENLCATSFMIYTKWEYLENNLASEVKHRSYLDNAYREHELVDLIKQVVTAMAFLQSHNKDHRMLSSSHILLDSSGKYKLTDPNFFQVVPNLAQVLDRSNGTPPDWLYLSPELVRGLAQRDPDPQVNHYLSDVFIFGLVVLETIELDHQHALFNYSHATYDRSLLQTKLEKVLQKGFTTVHQFLTECLQHDPSARPDWKKLKEHYGSLILQKSQVNGLIRSNLSKNIAYSSENY